MTDKKKSEELKESELEDVQGGIGLLLPAVQKVRDAGGSGKASNKAALETDGLTGPKTTGKIVANGGGNDI